VKYVGSKNKISKFIAPIIQKCIDDNNVKIYFEPFVGGANLIDKIKCETRIGNDVHKELIEMWKTLISMDVQSIPLHISEEEYIKVRDNKSSLPLGYVGFVGFHATFGSKYFGGYARGFKEDKVTPRDHSNESIRNTLKQLDRIRDIKFTCKSYLDFDTSKMKNCVIYCDPPSANTTKYNSGSFDHNVFWNWVRKVSKNNYVFVSEYNAPEDFECIWSKSVTTTLKVDKHEDREEKLFIPKQV
jgi:site-specific DNA-adenine methylase